MIDPELKYCLKCKDEYRADIVRCGVCGEELVLGGQVLAIEKAREERRAGRGGQLTEADDTVAIRKAPLAEVKALQAALARENFATLLSGDEHSCGKGCCPSNFYLHVRRADAHDAMAVLAREFARTTGLADHDLSTIDSVFDADNGQATCPACGMGFTTTTTTCPDCGLCFG